jgi:PPM family protein phosphatase
LSEMFSEGARMEVGGLALELGRSIRGHWRGARGWLATTSAGDQVVVWWFADEDPRPAVLRSALSPPTRWPILADAALESGRCMVFSTGLRALVPLPSTGLSGRMSAILGELNELARALGELHQRGMSLGGLDLAHLAVEPSSGRLSLWGWGGADVLAKPRSEAAWRDLRIFGDLLYQAHTGHTPLTPHDLAARLQSGDGMAEAGLCAPGVVQILAGCVTPHGDLAYLEAADLVTALGHLRAEQDRPARLSVGAQTTVGSYIFRKNNQDACGHILAETYEGSRRAPCGFFCVADGIGGIQDGERASGLAVRAGCAAFARLWANAPDQLGGACGAVARGIARVVSQQLALEGELGAPINRGGTTYTAVVIAQGRVGLAHVGDSRAYLWRAGQLVQLTRDHNLASIQALLGQRPAPGSQEEQTGKRTIARFLSTAQELEADRIDGVADAACQQLGANPQETLVQGLALREGDVLLLCSDGLHGDVSDEELAELLDEVEAPQALCEALVLRATNRSAHDNVTALAIRVG